jgi:hypothetical protein
MRTEGLLPRSQKRATGKNAERRAAFQKAKAKFVSPSQTKKEKTCNTTGVHPTSYPVDNCSSSPAGKAAGL